jgi:hypothetical protein
MRMNLFRSEEHVKNWSLYDPASVDAIMTVEDWAKVFAGPLFRRRRDADYLSRVDEYRADFGKVLLGDLGRSGPFFTGD